LDDEKRLRLMKATAIAHANIALIKYWGKRDERLNLPAVGSISVTLRELSTKTQVVFDEKLTRDELILNGTPAGEEERQRVSRFMDIIRSEAKISEKCKIDSRNNFPTGAGLASSASAFAALALASSHAAGLTLSPEELSILARRGSGSAARSVYGGFVEMKKGEAADGSDAFAVQLAPPEYWDLHILILITSTEQKLIGSTGGMIQTQETSPYYFRWISEQDRDLREMREAIRKRDFEHLGELAEFNALKMHATAIAARPGILYWNGTTVELIHEVRRLRLQGEAVYFTIDAGPQVKLICEAPSVDKLRQHFQNFPGIKQIIDTPLGPDAYLWEASK